jgi:type I restriction enzyme M protein
MASTAKMLLLQGAKRVPRHADLKDLIAAMRSHEAEVIRCLGEIEALVTEVQA